VIDEGGNTPVWNKTFEIGIASFYDDELRVACYDEDLIKDDFVGEAKFKITQIAKPEGRNAILILMDKGEKSAEITVQTKFTPSNHHSLTTASVAVNSSLLPPK
jgi:Ca2+-dependent lipid-binding protein